MSQYLKYHFKDRVPVTMIFFKMSTNLILHCIKKHLKLANVFYSVFVKLDKQSDKLIIVSRNVERIVVAFQILQILMITVKIWSVIAGANNLTQTILGVSLVSLLLPHFCYNATSRSTTSKCNSWITFSSRKVVVLVTKNIRESAILRWSNFCNSVLTGFDRFGTGSKFPGFALSVL